MVCSCDFATDGVLVGVTFIFLDSHKQLYFSRISCVSNLLVLYRPTPSPTSPALALGLRKPLKFPAQRKLLSFVQNAIAKCVTSVTAFLILKKVFEFVFSHEIKEKG